MQSSCASLPVIERSSLLPFPPVIDIPSPVAPLGSAVIHSSLFGIVKSLDLTRAVIGIIASMPVELSE
jgi:hypothetical protein